MTQNTILFHIKNENLKKVQAGMAALTKTALTILGKPRAGVERGTHFYIALVKVKNEKDVEKLNKIVEAVS